jgi:hypothetical protein
MKSRVTTTEEDDILGCRCREECCICREDQSRPITAKADDDDVFHNRRHNPTQTTLAAAAAAEWWNRTMLLFAI